VSFLNPILLFALTAVSVPIIIHLLNRRNFQRVVWAAMRFLNTSVEKNQRRMRIEDMILLALRCLLVVLIALMLARPALRSNNLAFLGAKATVVLLLDNSYSMCQSDGVSTRFDKARLAAEEMVGSLPSGSSVALLLASDIVNPVIAEPTLDANLVRKVIREARVSDHATDLLPAFKQAVDILRKTRNLQKEICLVTDNQALGWKQMLELEKLFAEARKQQVQTRVVMVGEPETQNIGVSRLTISSGLTPLNQPIRVEAQVRNYGREEVKSVKVSLAVDGDVPMDEAVVDVLPAGTAKGVSLFARLRSEGYHSIMVRVPADRLPADDRRTLAVRAIREVRVLLADGDPGREPRDSQVFFLRHALQPVPVPEASQYYIKTTVIPGLELASARFDDYDAVILANVSEVPANMLPALELFVKRGGGLMVFPGQNIQFASYNDGLLKRHNLLPAAFGQVKGDASRDEQYATLQEKDYEHPLVDLWNDPGNGTLNSARFFRYFELLPAAWKPEPKDNGARDKFPGAGEPKIVLRYQDGNPAVMEREFGLGRVIQFSSTANTGWNDLPVRPAFVPFMHRCLGAVAQHQDDALNVRVGQRFTYRLQNEQIGKDVVIVPPGDPAKAQRDLTRLELVQGVPTIQYDATHYGGAYDATISGDLKRVIRFAAQPDASESALESLSVDQMHILENSAQVIRWRLGISLRELVIKERVGTELWLPLLVAVILLAMVETFLAQWFSRTK
jgi:hypothetical protein